MMPDSHHWMLELLDSSIAALLHVTLVQRPFDQETGQKLPMPVIHAFSLQSIYRPNANLHTPP